ncbi:hypothetical protein EU91_1155 [Prochlorococcus marinus str. GP2]|uniref:Uncharacterized protein n=1 Tax=Prochlorococcus marinus str. GP2 TaxID=59925 RepID=A0A0A1ZDA6_PROMR|nr:hypothetical protein EU91_1155 [Prochlorococcus marinus str. GP2]
MRIVFGIDILDCNMGNNIEPFLNFILLNIIYKTGRKSSYKKKRAYLNPLLSLTYIFPEVKNAPKSWLLVGNFY